MNKLRSNLKELRFKAAKYYAFIDVGMFVEKKLCFLHCIKGGFIFPISGCFKSHKFSHVILSLPIPDSVSIQSSECFKKKNLSPNDYLTKYNGHYYF